MDNTINGKEANTMIGVPYKNINWEDIPGQPFGLASQFNLFILGDANNIIDVEGAMAVGGSFYSSRSLSIGFQREKGQVPIEFSPDLVRYLVGDVVSVKGPLGVIGHVVSGGSFRAAPGSTYYIGKDNSTNQSEELKYLYQANGGSPYWSPSDKGNYYIVPSYDVSRFIPASRISANISKFFQDARRSVEAYKNCIEKLNSNGTVTSNSYEWILTGSNPRQNIFTIDTRPNGLLNKGIRFNIPQGSVAIVKLRTGPHAHLQYGLYGEERLANQILYVFEDATNIHMEKSSDIWGSILAPQAMFHGHPTGGRVSGNAVLGGFAVNAYSGFEFHLYPFVGGVICNENTQLSPDIAPFPMSPQITPNPVMPSCPTCPEATCPETIPCPVVPPCPTCPEATPCPTCPEAAPCPVVPSCPTCPEAAPCPVVPPCPTCPEAAPCPVVPPCPTCPEATPCPVVPPCPTCPEQRPCPSCPTCPEQQPCPSCPTCPEQQPCPTCPTCPEQKRCPENRTEYIPIPIPIPMRTAPKTPVCPICPVCKECLITSGIIEGCVLGCDCSRNHEWDVMLYQVFDDKRCLIDCVTICHSGCFRFEVDYDGSYILKICPIKRNSYYCKPKITFTNIGVANFMIL